ncbi:CHAT domain-containing protein [Nonomuraea sp. NPDC050556]|uniref:glycoside hydrolase family 16 protein n=1 Tax=Nonomuraea sp. NPDC050556 TaxID=3364369 RepID=UPI003787D839
MTLTYAQARALLEGQRRAVMVEFFTMTDEVVLFKVTADDTEPEVVRLPLDQAALRRFVLTTFGHAGGVREMVSMGLEDLWHAHDNLVEPLSRWTDPDDLVILVPHGLLHYLPLHALRVDGGHLIDRNPVSYAPSASVLAACRNRRNRNAGAAVFGDPRGDLPQARVRAEEPADQHQRDRRLDEEPERQQAHHRRDPPGRNRVVQRPSDRPQPQGQRQRRQEGRDPGPVPPVEPDQPRTQDHGDREQHSPGHVGRVGARRDEPVDLGQEDDAERDGQDHQPWCHPKLHAFASYTPPAKGNCTPEGRPATIPRRLLLLGGTAVRTRLLLGVAVLVAALAPPLTANAAVARELIPEASDEFNGSALDTAKWRRGIWYKVSGNEQDGGAFRPENVTVSGGNLVISARTEDFGGRHHTYGAVESLFDVPGDNTYVEVRAKVLDRRANVLSAIWMQSSPLSVANNPNPEIDIHETFSYRRMVSTLHRWVVKPGTAEQHVGDGDKRVDFGVEDNSAGFHTYGLRRQYGILTFFQDGRPGWTVTPDDPAYSSLARHLVLSLEGHLGKPDEQYLPANFLIDYVRTYREPNPSGQADNRVTSWLKSDPAAGGGSACSDRQILLARGRYAWQVYNDTAAEQSHTWPKPGYREIDLDAGTYTWTECVTQQNGSYAQTSTLKRANSSLPAAQVAGPKLELDAGRTVQFGSTLRWLVKRS